MFVGLSGEMIKLAGCDIHLKFPIPGLRDKFLKPLGKRSKIRRGKSCDFGLNFLNTHVSTISKP
ncbi:MAG: hypothetical protein JWQ04_2556 [Pedosphaera sp.]|nr:hypothetical protein [Pedosphaera sp.]